MVVLGYTWEYKFCCGRVLSFGGVVFYGLNCFNFVWYQRVYKTWPTTERECTGSKDRVSNAGDWLYSIECIRSKWPP
jgi:hypothetical protein